MTVAGTADAAPLAPPVPDSFSARLTPGERAAVHELGVRRTFPRQAVLMFEHEPGDRVMLLLSGRVKTGRVGHDGHEVLLSLRDPGDLLGELAFIDGQPRLATVTALEPVEALVIAAHSFRAHLETTPRVAVALLEVITRRFRDTTLKRSQFAMSDTLARLAARIVELAERYGQACDAGVAVVSPLSQEELAAWIGASRAGVAHALQTVRELGWVDTDRRHYLIRDIYALRARAA